MHLIHPLQMRQRNRSRPVGDYITGYYFLQRRYTPQMCGWMALEEGMGDYQICGRPKPLDEFSWIHEQVLLLRHEQIQSSRSQLRTPTHDSGAPSPGPSTGPCRPKTQPSTPGQSRHRSIQITNALNSPMPLASVYLKNPMSWGHVHQDVLGFFFFFFFFFLITYYFTTSHHPHDHDDNTRAHSLN
jgi:hypothetical protein